MEYLDLTGLQALWQKTKELVSARSCVLTYPTNGETITTDTYNNIISAITNSIPVIIRNSNDNTNYGYTCTTTDNTNGVLTLVWLDKTCTTKYTCIISTARKVTLTSSAICDTSSDVYIFDTGTKVTNGDKVSSTTYNELKQAVQNGTPVVILNSGTTARALISVDSYFDGSNIKLRTIDTEANVIITFTISNNYSAAITTQQLGGSSTTTSSDVVYFTLPRDENGSVLQHGTEVEALYNKLLNNIGKNKIFCYAEHYNNTDTGDEWKNSYPAAVYLQPGSSPQIFIMYFDFNTESIKLYYVTSDDSDYTYYLAEMAQYNLASFYAASKSIPYVIDGEKLIDSGQTSYRKQVLTDLTNAITYNKPVFVKVTSSSGVRRIVVNDLYIMKSSNVVSGCTFSYRNNIQASTNIKEIFITISETGAFNSKNVTYPATVA